MQRYDRGEFEIKMCNWRQTTPIIPNIPFWKLDSKLNQFRSQKEVEATDELAMGRLTLKRRQTILPENNIFE